MAEVWAATNLLTDREFALKLVLPSLAKRPEIVQRFLQEARATGRLKHPAIVDVFDVGQAEDGRPFMVMELLEGQTLDQRLTRRGPLTSLEAAAIMAQVARALQHAHYAGIVHRDLSSANVFLVASRRGQAWPKVLDFGVSKLMGELDSRVRTDSGSVVGSPAYMSPEQAQGSEDVDARTDIWALGVLLYECLTGRTPFAARNYNALMLAIMTVPHSPVRQLRPDVPQELCEIIESCLVKDPAARLESAGLAAARLQRAAHVLGEGRDAPGPRRRAADRLPLPPKPAAVAGRQRFVQLARRPGMKSGALAVGSTVVGIALGSAWATGATARDATATGVAALRVGLAPRRLPTVSIHARPAPQRVAQETRGETDLVRAAAQGLGLSPRSLRRPR